ncbi:MAG: hypothetical protein LBS92_03185 [Candidatus Methanoplasma sp.]|jgi:uncharacterized protein with HEPN domain|nr:hypothetical protein [Candidatus Methanoplasma sp.]
MAGDAFSMSEESKRLSVAELRGVIAHRYWKLDMGSVWLAAAQDVPGLKTKFERVLDELEEPPNRKNQLSG